MYLWAVWSKVVFPGFHLSKSEVEGQTWNDLILTTVVTYNVQTPGVSKDYEIYKIGDLFLEVEITGIRNCSHDNGMWLLKYSYLDVWGMEIRPQNKWYLKSKDV